MLYRWDSDAHQESIMSNSTPANRQDDTARTAHPYGILPPGFRLPEATHVGAVRLQVRDLQRSVDYYLGVLGLELQNRSAAAATLGAPHADRPLVRLEENGELKPARRRGAFGLFHFAILLPERAALGQFVEHLSRLEARVGMADHLVSEALYLTDPDGLGIEVYADRPRNSWQHTGRELVMTTDPLNVPDLVSAAGGKTWQGAPAGTSMGHVHLHVGNLDAAEAFYHAALGFDKVVWSYPGALFLSAGGYHHHLGTNTWAPGPSARDDEARLLEWELIVPEDRDAIGAAQSLQAAGFPTDTTAAGTTTADPWGTRLRVLSESSALRT
jgi:catechol 2,3-dioxygenase